MSVKLTFIFFGGNMSLEEIREANIKKVVKKALEMFTENGIVNTKVNDIAIACNLTERSLFRYFKTKSDLVIASCIMFWRNLYQESFKAYDSLDKNIDIFEKIFNILKAYSHQFFENKKSLIFVQESEAFLFRNQKVLTTEERPISNIKETNAPLSLLLQEAIEDKKIFVEDVNELYQMIFCSLLGYMQKLACDIYDSNLSKETQLKRLDSFCEMLVNSLKEKKEIKK